MRLILAGTLLSFDLELCEESKGWIDQKVFVLWDKPLLMCRLTPVTRGKEEGETLEKSLI
jgi:hypothetical protein